MAVVKLFYIRHQAAGILTDVAYIGTPPSQADLDAARAKLSAVHGDTHKKTGEPYWLTVQEACAHIPDLATAESLPKAELPKPPEANGVGDEGSSGLPRFVVTGEGTVSEGDPATADERREKARAAKGR